MTLMQRLDEYLNQIDPLLPARSLRQSEQVDRALAQAGIAPTKTITLPPNFSEIESTLGDPHSMNQSKQPDTRVRIASTVLQTTFLHIEDALNIGKLRLFAGQYRKGGGMTQHITHYVDLDDARYIFHALLHNEPNFRHKEYKGSAGNGLAPVSRVLTINSKKDKVFFNFKTGPGRLGKTGAIMPDGQATAELNIGLDTSQARRIAAAALAYIQAWDVVRMFTQQSVISAPLPYTLAPSAANGRPAATNGRPIASKTTTFSAPPMVNGRPVASKTAAAPTPLAANGRAASKTAAAPTPPAANGRPVASKTAAAPTPPAANGRPTTSKTAAAPTPPAANGRLALFYQDGSAPDQSNQTEIATFHRFRRIYGRNPDQKAELIQFYRKSPPQSAAAV